MLDSLYDLNISIILKNYISLKLNFKFFHFYRFFKDFLLNFEKILGLLNRNRVTNISLVLEFGERVKGDVVEVYVNFYSTDSVKDFTQFFVSGYNADILKGISNVKILAFLIQHAKMK